MMLFTVCDYGTSVSHSQVCVTDHLYPPTQRTESLSPAGRVAFYLPADSVPDIQHALLLAGVKCPFIKNKFKMAFTLTTRAHPLIRDLLPHKQQKWRVYKKDTRALQL
jgi:hypothetical protein